MDEQVYSKLEIQEILKDRFISVKVQMDRTTKDDSYSKSWYTDVDAIKANYHIEAYPTMLFLNADGTTIAKKTGGVDVSGFKALVNDVLNPDKRFDHLENLYNTKKMNIKDYPGFAKQAKDQGNYDIYMKVLSQYKKIYLDKLSISDLLTSENIAFMFRYTDIIDSKDRFYLLCKNQPSQVDTLVKKLNVPGTFFVSNAAAIVRIIDVREMITSQWYDSKANIIANPNWIKIRKDFLSRYKRVDAVNVFYDYKIKFYAIQKDWNRFANAVDAYIKECPQILNETYFLLYGLNNFAWFQIFNQCNDPKIIERATRWSQITIDNVLENQRPDMMDTKANLLYKLGKNEEAIALMKSIVDLKVKVTGKPEKEAGGNYFETLQKMKKGEQTWP